MSFLGDLIKESSNGKAKMISGQELIDMLNGKPGALRNVLGDVKDCGQADCPIHGHDDDNSLTSEDLEVMEPEEMEMLALSATGAASNALMHKEFGLTVLLQQQADLWLRCAERKRAAPAEVRADEAEPVL